MNDHKYTYGQRENQMEQSLSHLLCQTRNYVSTNFMTILFNGSKIAPGVLAKLEIKMGSLTFRCESVTQIYKSFISFFLFHCDQI